MGIAGKSSERACSSASSMSTGSRNVEVTESLTAVEVAVSLPNVGSAGHTSGKCQPCAFFHSGRCVNNERCKFCHLCDDSERKRRRKEKVELLRAKRASRGAATEEC